MRNRSKRKSVNDGRKIAIFVGATGRIIGTSLFKYFSIDERVRVMDYQSACVMD